jgi:hypothetical protein
MCIFSIVALIISFILITHHLKLIPQRKKRNSNSFKPNDKREVLYKDNPVRKQKKTKEKILSSRDVISKKKDNRFIYFTLVTVLVFTFINGCITGNSNILYASAFFSGLFFFSIFLASIVVFIRYLFTKKWDNLNLTTFIFSIVISILVIYGIISSN